jgi:predicted CopG family antitoxin
MDGKTTIQISKENLEKLKQMRLTRRETYNEIISRLLDFYQNNKK